MTYSTNAKPECRFTLVVEDGKADQVFSLCVPIFVYGAGAERTAEGVDTGDLIAVDGRLSWKSTVKRDGTKLGLCVTCFGVELLSKAEVPVAAGDVEPDPEPEGMEPAPAKPRKRPYPRAALEGGFSEN